MFCCQRILATTGERLGFQNLGNLQLQIRDSGITPLEKIISLLSVLPKISCPCFSKFRGLTDLDLMATLLPDSSPCLLFPVLPTSPVFPAFSSFLPGPPPHLVQCRCLSPKPWPTHPLSGYVSQCLLAVPR